MHQLNKKQKRRHFNLLVAVIFSLFQLQVGWTIHLQGLSEQQKTCRQLLDEAEENYYNDNMNQAIQLVLHCLSLKSVTKNNKLRAYTILTRIHLVKEEPDKAKEMIKKILIVDPSYQPTIEQETPRFVNLVQEIKKTWQAPVLVQTTPDISSWIWIGAGVLATTAIVVIITSGNGNGSKGSDAQALPKPPDFPE